MVVRMIGAVLRMVVVKVGGEGGCGGDGRQNDGDSDEELGKCGGYMIHLLQIPFSIDAIPQTCEHGSIHENDPSIKKQT